jgi:hypothetical protein
VNDSDNMTTRDIIIEQAKAYGEQAKAAIAHAQAATDTGLHLTANEHINHARTISVIHVRLLDLLTKLPDEAHNTQPAIDMNEL